jgi:hypothetical protein
MSLHNNNKVKMHLLVDRWTALVFIFYLIVRMLNTIKKNIMPPHEDGWRRATRAYFRTEQAKYCLVTLGLDFWSDALAEASHTYEQSKQHLVNRFMQFCRDEPILQWQLTWKGSIIQRKEKRQADIVCARFSEHGVLNSIEVYLDDLNNKFVMEHKWQVMLNKRFVFAYNATRMKEDKIRPWKLKKKLHNLVLSLNLEEQRMKEVTHYLERVMSATFIFFEDLTGDNAAKAGSRFKIPDFLHRKHPGFGYLNICCRFGNSYQEADLWIQASHIPHDGAAVQKALQMLKQKWGIFRELRLPALSELQNFDPELQLADRKSGKYVALKFIDFTHLLEKRRELNSKFITEAGGKITFVSMLAWGLAQAPAYRDLKMLFALDLLPISTRERTVGLVFIRPGSFIDQDNALECFLHFQREFNRRVLETKARHSASYELTESFALLPPSLYSFTLKLLPRTLAEFIGSVGFSVVKDTDIMVGPLSDVHPDGFIAVGNTLLPTADGKVVGAVCVKGSKKQVLEYIEVIEKIAVDFGCYFS